MKKNIWLPSLAVLAVLAIGLVGFVAVDAGALSLSEGIQQSKGTGVPDADSIDGESGIVTTVINVILYVVGIVSVVMLIFGGIQYSTSAGDTTKVKNAKNTILYSVVGLLVSVFAYALINWVLKEVGVTIG